jgi:hypothetical protein
MLGEELPVEDSGRDRHLLDAPGALDSLARPELAQRGGEPLKVLAVALEGDVEVAGLEPRASRPRAG